MLATFGRKIFGRRLGVGLVITLIGLEVLCPKPFLHPPDLVFQALGLLTVALGLVLRGWASGCAGSHTRSGRIEAPRLVTGGPFAYVRNPIYMGSILIGLGMSTLVGDPLAYAFTAIAFLVLYLGIVPTEEDHLARMFGAEYERYREAVPRLIPRLRPWSERRQTEFQSSAAHGELFIALLLVAIYLLLHFEEYLDQIFPWA